jgi:hypothetical protein
VLDPRYKLTWYKAVGWQREWIESCRKRVTALWKSKYQSVESAQEETIASTNNVVQPAGVTKNSFRDLFHSQMKSVRKSSETDELKRYLLEGVVNADVICDKTGIKGVLGWWQVGAL